MAEVLRAYRYALDPTPSQIRSMTQHAGSARWAYNWALAHITRAQQQWAARRDALLANGLTAAQAKRRISDEAAPLRAVVDTWDHHRKMLMRQRRAKPGPAPKLPAHAPEDLVRELAAHRAAAGEDRDAQNALLKAARARILQFRQVQFERGDRVPSDFDLNALWRATRDNERDDGGSPWWPNLNPYVFTTAFSAATGALQAWMASHAGRRSGPKVHYPRFKRKGRARESFRVHHDVKRPGIRLCTYRRLRVPGIGEVRLHESAKRLVRLVDRGQAVVQSVTISRGGHRWYASVLCKVQQDLPGPTRRQRAAGTVGVDWGTTTLATLTDPITLEPGGQPSTTVPNPRYGRRAQQHLTRAQRALSRSRKGSQGRARAARLVARLHHEVAERRATYLHTVTKRLTTGFATVAVEDLNVIGMVRSARGTPAVPGRGVRAQSRRSRAVLETSPGELRRQLAYKTSWYGSQLAVVDRGFPSSKTCSACGRRKPSLALSERVFTCECGLRMGRDANAARNIAAQAVSVPVTGAVASGAEETLNARGVTVRPTVPTGRGQVAVKRAGSPQGESPRGSDPPAVFVCDVGG